MGLRLRRLPRDVQRMAGVSSAVVSFPSTVVYDRRMTTTDVATVHDIADLADLLARLAPRVGVASQGSRGRLWACLTAPGGFRDEEAALLHSVGLMVVEDRCLVPPDRVGTVIARLALIGGEALGPLVWHIEITDEYATSVTPALVGWNGGEVAVRTGEGTVTRWDDHWPDPALLDRYLRSSQHYRVRVSPFEAGA